MNIINTTNVEVELYSIPVVSSKSSGEAVRAGLSSPVAQRAKADSALIKGHQVVEGCWDWNQAAFLLSGGISLHIFSNGGYADWLIGGTAAYDNLRQRLPSPRTIIIAKFVTATGEAKSLESCKFCAHDLVAACVGKEVFRIGIRHTSLCFQFRGTHGWFVFFEPMKRHDNGEPFLLWIEDRD
jgi:hypothetical protein